MLYVSPFSPTPTGAITGMKSLRSSDSITVGLTARTSPTRPMSIRAALAVLLHRDVQLARQDQVAVLAARGRRRARRGG